MTNIKTRIKQSSTESDKQMHRRLGSIQALWFQVALKVVTLAQRFNY
jgi:hypothetical protein